MKNELKTLKDLEEEEEFTDSISVYKLKSEAVKWVKQFRKEDVYRDTRSWIIHFFNLTEEDLQ